MKGATVKTKDSAVQWIEVNIGTIVKECGGDIGPTSRHRYALHIFEGLAHTYFDMIQEEYDKHRAEMRARSEQAEERQRAR